MNNEAIFILLFMVATTVAIGVRWLHLPYTVALVIAGLILGWAHLFPAPELTKGLLFSVFLPGLIFEAAFHIDFDEFWRNRVTIASLAVPGVIASIALIVVILSSITHMLHFTPGFSWRHALVFGALISATDPIAVIAIFKRLGVPRRLGILLDGESLLNDGTGIVFFTLSLSLLAGSQVHAGSLALEFLLVVGMGVLIGSGVGLTVSTLIRQVDDPMIEITLTTIAAYGSFVAAEQLHYSGVIATVTAGIVCGNYGARTGMSPSTRISAETFWDYIAFALNSIVFLLIGLEVRIDSLIASWPAILIAYLVVTLGRALVIQAVWALLGVTRERFPWTWSLAMTWGGLRGALPMVLALSLPATFEYRDSIVTMTFGVVLISILVHGLSMSAVLRRLGIVHAGTDRRLYELSRGRLHAADAALAEIERMSQRHLAEADVLEALRDEYHRAIERDKEDMGGLSIDRRALHAEESSRVRRRLLMVEKRSVIDAYHEGRIDRSTHDRLLADIDARLLEVETRGADDDTP